MGTEQYDPKFYNAIREGCIASAKAVVPIVLRQTGPVESVVDVGGGEGWWAQAFRHAGATTALCVDSGTRQVEAEGVTFGNLDLNRPLPHAERHDLAVCLEVAEHLPETRADELVHFLCASADTVLFSAAMPRQGGTGHVNCQPPAYWAEKFAERGYGCDGSLRWRIWNLPGVEPWYKSNLLLFTRRYSTPAACEAPLHVIHPDLFLQPRR